MTFFTLALAVHTLIFYVGPSKGNSPQIRVTTSLFNFDGRIAEGWSGGGGDRWLIDLDPSPGHPWPKTGHPFTGRYFGGAGRGDLKGTSIFGSGYPYGTRNRTTIAGRPFPYGLWPIYWGDEKMASGEYGPALDGLRPGGELVTIQMTAQTHSYNTTREETYYMVGDRDSVLFMMISLVTSCHVIPAWPSKFVPTSPESIVKFENIIQYYRASSFALAYLRYNSTASPSFTDSESASSAPLPDIVVHSQFRKCLDEVIVNALPIMNKPPDPSIRPLTETLEIVFGIFGAPILLIAYTIASCVVRQRKDSERRKERQQQRALALREAALAYENYPQLHFCRKCHLSIACNRYVLPSKSW